MTRTTHGLRRLAGLLAALSLAFGYATAPPVSAADPVATALPAWDGSVDLYRDGVFTTQKSWLWCTAAGVQIVRNIVDDREDHTVSGQRRYFNYMREHNRYALPLSAGVDPQGWTAGLRRYVDDRYRLTVSTTFDNALRSAVKRLRLTNLPVALTVAHGNHGWILTGFAATADPSVTASFKVTSVRIVGPLYGLQSRNGYDMPPDTKLTPTQLKRYFTPWKYPPKAMIWDGRYVSIQPVPATTASSGTAAAATPPVGTEASPAAKVAPSMATSDRVEVVPPAQEGSAAEIDPLPTSGSAADPLPTEPSRDPGPAPAVIAVALLIAAVVIIATALARRLSDTGRRGGSGISARVPG